MTCLVAGHGQGCCCCLAHWLVADGDGDLSGRSTIVTLGNLHRLRVRRVPCAEPGRHGHLAEQLTVPCGRHLHLRGLTRLPVPAEPDQIWVMTRSATAGGCCRSRWTPGLLQPRFPRYGATDHQSRAGRRRHVSHARDQGRAEAVEAVSAAKALGIAPRRTPWYDIEGFDSTPYRLRESALASSADGPSSARARYVSASTPAPARASRCSTTRASTGPRVRPARHDLAGPLGRDGQHARRASATTAGGPAAA